MGQPAKFKYLSMGRTKYNQVQFLKSQDVVPVKFVRSQNSRCWIGMEIENRILKTHAGYHFDDVKCVSLTVATWLDLSSGCPAWVVGEFL